ncbi:MAG: hypothetical protein IAE77_29060 [Prosthecobacter sp.]|jgi:hypothetical protein|uniref:hypothetical protein n=1 Tax=Prosthecobacter sp. TaxID=1965333 RepID=UPI0019FFA700|nr:hypothetical protein [Prosthecobacter sp.]MBE2287541.1 hypothetical protein [Prosthecobacter sp.]
MKDLVYLSRAFVEFGPFTKKEILDFQKRGILSSADYLRSDGSDSWLHYEEWLTIVPITEPKLVKKPVAAKEAAAPAKAPAKKAKKAA